MTLQCLELLLFFDSPLNFIRIEMKNVNYTSSLPSDLLEMLDQYAVKFKVPKNRIIENSLIAYFENLKKAEYIRSFKKAAGVVAGN